MPDPPGEHVVVLAASPEGYRQLSVAARRGAIGARGEGRAARRAVRPGRRIGDWLVLTGCRKGPVAARALRRGPERGARARSGAWPRRSGPSALAVELWDLGEPERRRAQRRARRDRGARRRRRGGHQQRPLRDPRGLRPGQRALGHPRAPQRRRDGGLASRVAARVPAQRRRAGRRFARLPGVVDARGRARRGDARSTCASSRRACRTSRRPTGWTSRRYLDALVDEGATAPLRAARRRARAPARGARSTTSCASSARSASPATSSSSGTSPSSAAREGIYCQGRGSAANSAVCYSLGVTNADAVSLDLLFERFLSPARDGPPDIDVDIESGRREEVIQYVYERYGRRHAAQVANVITYRSRSAVRDVARALGMTAEAAPTTLRRLRSSRKTRGARGRGAAATRIVGRWRPRLLDRPRHLGLHSAGMVICDRPVIEVCPVEWARMRGPHRAAVGQGRLRGDRPRQVRPARPRHARRAAPHGRPVAAFDGVDLDLGALAQDEAVYDLLCEADTVGVFQVESRAQMATLPRMRPRCFYDLVIEVALIRPGPIQGHAVNPYLRRRRGEEAVTYLHPRLEPILARTLGVPLFQEQLMEMAVAVAGFCPGRGRRAAPGDGARSAPSCACCKLKGRLYAGMAGQRDHRGAGRPALRRAGRVRQLRLPRVPRRVLRPPRLLLGLDQDATTRRRSSSRCSTPSRWASGRPRASSPTPRATASSSSGPTSTARACGATLEPAPTSRRRRCASGWGRCAGSATTVAERIAAGAPWAGPGGPRAPGGVTPRAPRGARRGRRARRFGPSRRALTWTAGAAAQASPDRLEGIVTGLVAPALRRADAARARGRRPVGARARPGGDRDLARARVARPPAAASRARRALLGAEAPRVTVAGVVTHRQHPETAHGAVFVNLEDETGHVNVIFSKGAWARWRHVARGSPALVIRGTPRARAGQRSPCRPSTSRPSTSPRCRRRVTGAKAPEPDAAHRATNGPWDERTPASPRSRPSPRSSRRAARRVDPRRPGERLPTNRSALPPRGRQRTSARPVAMMVACTTMNPT